MKKIIISLILIVTFFFVSWLFFLNSGIIDDNWELDEIQTVKITAELDKLPLINTDELVFDSHGTLMEIGNETLTFKEGNETFIHSENISGLNIGDEVRVEYKYSSEYEKEVLFKRKG